MYLLSNNINRFYKNNIDIITEISKKYGEKKYTWHKIIFNILIGEEVL